MAERSARHGHKLDRVPGQVLGPAPGPGPGPEPTVVGPGMGGGDEFWDELGRVYHAGEELGRGVLTVVRAAVSGVASGVAFGAASVEDGPSLALKTSLPLWVGHPIAEARIARERQLSDAIHAADAPPALPCVRILAGGRQPCGGGRSRPFHVTHRLSGTTLAEVLRGAKTGVPLSDETAMRWALDLCDALERIHAVGWVHRDIKPQNVFVVDRLGGPADLPPEPPFAPAAQVRLRSPERVNGRAWLIDFGLALPIGASRGDNDEPFGTPAYVSPEVIAGAAVDPRADLYSLGLVLFELFAGQRAFASRDPIALLDAHLCQPPPRLRSMRPSCSAPLERLISDTLGKDPGERPADIAELRVALRGVPEARGVNETSDQTCLR